MAKITKKQIEERENLKNEYRKILKPGTILYTKLNHVSRSGMTREISVYYMENNIPVDISCDMGKIIDHSIGKTGGIRVGGCGQDMGFWVVYLLSRLLYPSGFSCIGEGCPASDHFNGVDTNFHDDGGYALIRKWL